MAAGRRSRGRDAVDPVGGQPQAAIRGGLPAKGRNTPEGCYAGIRPGDRTGAGRSSENNETTTLHGQTRPSMSKPDPPWANPTLHGVTSRRASPPGRSSPAHRAQSPAQLPGEAGGLGHTPENGPGGNRPWGHRSVHGIARGRSSFAQYPRTSRRPTRGAKGAPGHGWPPVGTVGGGTDDRGGSRREGPRTLLLGGRVNKHEAGFLTNLAHSPGYLLASIENFEDHPA